MSTIVPPAQAQMSFNFSAPFIADSGLIGASGSQHFITVAVTGHPLTDLMITLPNDMRVLEGIKITDQMGKEVAANVAVSTGSITINFPQPVAPDNFLKITLSGVKMDRAGGTAIYRVSAMKEGLVGQIPIGTAIVRLRETSN
ncbi:MAG: DUF2808 domain-containing protein [Coleofasciculus sp. S288]|nr:DUF2808 domain-containing protein [Coleofasciculus sp. S288]